MSGEAGVKELHCVVTTATTDAAVQRLQRFANPASLSAADRGGLVAGVPCPSDPRGQSSPRRVRAALESVDVQLPNERAQIVMFEVEREHVLCRRGRDG
eukprot:scaffold87870_cov60-Phaeocystis_antarctica.AAC.2